MRIAFDTGYFLQLATGTLDPTHRPAFISVADGEAVGFASGIVLYEIRKQGYKGAISPNDAEFLCGTIEDSCQIVWPDTADFMDQTARLSHGNGLSMADAMILQSALSESAQRLYTTDSDLHQYDGPIEVITL
jgi:predicted nucleic acid-binding protein